MTGWMIITGSTQSLGRMELSPVSLLYRPVPLLKCLSGKGIAGIFFSATMIPVMYYKKLLSGNPEDFAVYANSPFDRENG